jgi:cell division septation protein DedD
MKLQRYLMKNWLKNLLFVLFSFLFLGFGMLLAEIFIRKKGNPLKDPNFLVESTTDTAFVITDTLSTITDDWSKDTITSLQAPQQTPEKETLKSNNDYLVIVGIFGKKSNANREVQKLKDLGYKNAYSFPKSSLDVVSAGQFSQEEAQNIASSLKSKGYDTVVKHQ